MVGTYTELVHYLPYKLKLASPKMKTGGRNFLNFSGRHIRDNGELIEDLYKPVLNRLNSLTSEDLSYFTENFRMYYNRPQFNVDLMLVTDFKLACMMHLDIFGLIDKGMAICKSEI